ncbi:MAG: hypothetical protein BroJett022_04310 [Actinomycetes bacterium]|nr:MAG: hypothetical protein BroJett022_04310 [Actinomycetes bacterium]
MGAGSEREAWIAAVKAVASDRGLRYEEVGGINPRDAPAALCPGGANRLTGELAPGFWGSSCDADEFEAGRMLRKVVLPAAVLAKAHMPDLTEVVPAFDVESIERAPDEQLRRLSRLRVEFESIDFNRRFIATVPSGHDPVAVRELFSPGFLEWATSIDRQVGFGASERQLYFLWRLRERSRPELELALDNAGELFRRVRLEMEESNVATYPAGPWHAGMEPFPA